MPKFKDYNQCQSMLLPPDIKEWIPGDHVCFVINDVVDKLDTDCVENTYSQNGCPAYNPRMLIKIIFYSYAQGVRSSRKIEKMAQENIACRYLSANQCPDHGTINLFRKGHLDDLENLFSQIVILCDGLNIIDPSDISIDGSIFKANASKKTTYTDEAVKKLKKKIREILNEAEQIDEEEDKKFGDRRGYNQMPEKLANPETRKKEIDRLRNKMEQLKKADKAIKRKQSLAKTGEEKKLSRNSSHNITDQDANLMKMKKGKTYQPAYNGQIATSNRVILAYDVSGMGADTEFLLPMIEKTENNTGKKVKQTKADAGYFSKSNIKQINEKGIDGYIPDRQKTIEEKQAGDNAVPEYDRRNFQYDKKKDEFICPRNKRLRLAAVEKERRKYICGDCGKCRNKSECAKGKNRYIYIDRQLDKYKAAMRKKLNGKKGKKKYLERMGDVEPCFGNIIYNQNAGHFLCRGKPMVKIEFGLSCVAHNLVKIANWVKENGNNIKETQLDGLTRLPAAA